MRGVWVIPALLVVLLASAAGDEEAGVRQWLHLRSELADARARIDGLRGEVDGLREEARLLESDEFAIEKAIREELGLARPGQSIVRLRAGVSSARIP